MNTSFTALSEFFLEGVLHQGIGSLFYSSNRSEASLRLPRFLSETRKLGFSLDKASLIVASIGELSNNCFDHNLGYWKDTPGCCLAWGFENDLLTIGIADRGRGIVASLSPVVSPKIPAQEVIEMSFEKVITGRAPEVRGNGLKFVRKAIEASPQNSLIAFSNDVTYTIGTVRPPAFLKLPRSQSFGTLLFTQWRLA